MCGRYVAGNLVREFGIWQKQSSAWFQALAALTTIESNVVFNGPRAVRCSLSFGFYILLQLVAWLTRRSIPQCLFSVVDIASCRSA